MQVEAYISGCPPSADKIKEAFLAVLASFTASSDTEGK